MVERDANGRFVKGHTGNPNGRPRRATEEEYLCAFNETMTVEDWVRIIRKAITQAKGGDRDARRFLADYALGKPKQRVALTGDDGGPLILRWLNDWRRPDADIPDAE